MLARSGAATGSGTGDASIPTGVASTSHGTIAPPMLKSLVRTFRGPSRDPRMTYISRPLPRDLPDEQVVEAIEMALAGDPNPASLVETLPAALKRVTGRDLQVMDRSVRDVTGAYAKIQIMIRDGSVGSWPGYAATSYPLIAPSPKAEATMARPPRPLRSQGGSHHPLPPTADGSTERPARPVAGPGSRVPALRRADHRGRRLLLAARSG